MGLDYISEIALSEKQSSEPGSMEGQNFKVTWLELSFISIPKAMYTVNMSVFFFFMYHLILL